MCGILGYVSEKVHLEESDFRLALSKMNHRGPDAEGIFHNHNTFLGHKRLSIIDLSEKANQPMISKNGRFVIVFNGEIYNYQELARQFNITQNTTSDTEIILELFQQRGNDVPTLFNGMFSFAIYDKEKKEIYLTRDRLGIKPLFYFSDENVFAFASELKSLVSLPYIKNHLKINLDAIKSYLHLGYIPQPQTIYNNIFKFPSGSYAIVKEGKNSFTEFWKPENLIKPKTLNDEKEALTSLNSLLTESVNYRLICDVPFGTLLSGGIDSSIVTAIASKVSSSKIKTYSIGFKEQDFNEAPFAKQVASHLNTDHHEYFVSEKDALILIPELLNQYDEPYADSSAIPTMLVSKMAAKEVKMVLSGDGGDELFHGYGSYIWANRLNKTHLKSTRKIISAGLSVGNNRHQRAAKVFNHNNKNIESHIFSQEQYFFSESEIENIFNDGYKNLNGFNYNKSNINRILTPAENQALFDINYYLKDDLLVKVDRASMKYSLEVRVPLLDYRIVEFALNLSPELKIKNGIQKYLLKELLYSYCPREIFDRPKRGFAVPLDKWLKGDLQYLIHENLSEDAIIKTGIFNFSAIQKLLNQYQSGKSYLYNRIWNLIIIQQFLLKHNF